jgi:hypothetical protein
MYWEGWFAGTVGRLWQVRRIQRRICLHTDHGQRGRIIGGDVMTTTPPMS